MSTLVSLLAIPLQPRPLSTRVAHEDDRGHASTAIARLFRPEDVGRCRLCPLCTACPSTGLCLVVARRHVPDRDAPLYAFRGGDCGRA